MKGMWLALGALAGVTGSPSGAAVEVRTFQYREKAIEVRLGTRVVWTNRDQIEHTITSGRPTVPTAYSTRSWRGRERRSATRSPRPEPIATSATGTTSCAARSRHDQGE